MYGRLYTVIFENVTVSAAQDLLELTPADDKPVTLHGFTLSNVGGAADAGDAQEELLRLTINRGNTTSGSGGSAPTPVQLNPNAAAPGFTAEVNNTTRASAGTKVTPFADGWNVRIPYVMMFTPETRIGCTQTQTLLTISLEAAPADALSVSATFFLEEF